jgi:DtxR family Mn-dependent transcriptional regulator
MTKFNPRDLTISGEDYLKAIYHLSEAGAPATTTGIAEALALTAPSVSGMVKRLADAGLLEHLPYKGVTLTEAGRQAALKMLRRHRVIEAYLVSFLGYGWDTVHDEAERLEHAVSDDLVNRMAEALGNPTVDPHGDPIPTADGRLVEVPSTPLPEVPVGSTVMIARVDSGSAERLRWLAEAGLVPGATVTVMAQQPFSGPITVQLGGADRIVGHELANQLHCAAAPGANR